MRIWSDVQYLHITSLTVISSDRSSFYLKHEQCIYINIKPTYETFIYCNLAQIKLIWFKYGIISISITQVIMYCPMKPYLAKSY